MNRGILATCYANLKDGVSEEEIRNAYEKYYSDEYFIRLLEKGNFPETRWVEGSNFVDIGFTVDERTGRVITVGALDNLVKGAAGQAVQNMNLMFGLPENTGLKLVPLFP
jgi:N-acetyl-gamma-glutamyl-phosphate reductase